MFLVEFCLAFFRVRLDRSFRFFVGACRAWGRGVSVLRIFLDVEVVGSVV